MAKVFGAPFSPPPLPATNCGGRKNFRSLVKRGRLESAPVMFPGQNTLFPSAACPKIRLREKISRAALVTARVRGRISRGVSEAPGCPKTESVGCKRSCPRSKLFCRPYRGVSRGARANSLPFRARERLCSFIFKKLPKFSRERS